MKLNAVAPAFALMLMIIGPAYALNNAASPSVKNSVREDATNADGFDASLAVFTPAAPQAEVRMPYPVLDIVLKRIVVDFGPSARISHQQRTSTGTKFRFGHSGVAALEGNRVTFSRFSPTLIEALGMYRHDLEKLGSAIDFARLTHNQQLAYWYNLHNITVIEQIARHYPVIIPENILIGAQKTPLHDAKILKVKGIGLSLRDIRTKIVFQHWTDPLVIYGFFLGSVGGPSIQTQAYTGDNVQDMLGANAEEFINSLRGVRRFNRKVFVAAIYREAAALFPDWPHDLRTHLMGFAQVAVQRSLAKNDPFSTSARYPRVADLMGGQPFISDTAQKARIYGAQAGFFGAMPSNSTGLISTKTMRGGGYDMPVHAQDLMQAVDKKNIVLKRRLRRESLLKERIVIVGEDRDAKMLVEHGLADE